MILIQSNAASLARWELLSDQQRADFGNGHMALTEELAASGHLVASEGLGDPGLGKHVSLREGKPMVTDGPFAEAKEHLAGFYVVECADFDEAAGIAARVPDVLIGGSVEIRPVFDPSQLSQT
ncbi:YciI family protein [Allokutzneria sp. A3M-2-11 16]|uniref:YciI family protein n=1 Tax=Allokutzneria sp. A3M-2-11 16 TaxID=2962043 RepID=UPI0020B8BBAC|nr:YciI family protein [Allokutzneria sp. A3M-2-11 16]MCP3802893.1 YciI family protein [Allokutzneria sp. A3M-2-11 16]